MTFVLNIPPSQLAELSKKGRASGADDDDDEDGPTGRKKSREEHRQLKELEEARKAGTVPALQDEEGKDINPHIPQYVMQAPWYYGAMQPTLKHQKLHEHLKQAKESTPMTEWYKRGVKQGETAVRYRKGACENCGALTHKKKDCMERPRKVGAKFTGDEIAPDEFVQPELKFTYETKRDRWNGFNTVGYNRKMAEHYQNLEEAKERLKTEKLTAEMQNPKDPNETSVATVEPRPKDTTATLDGEEDGDDDDVKGVDDMDMPGQKMDTSERMTVRNLRIREDTAKYLYNLDVNSAYYDPKTRSMRGNPLEGKTTGRDGAALPYHGDNFVRCSGDAKNMVNQQVFAWDAHRKGVDVHLQADPTKLELLAREFKEKKGDIKREVAKGVLEKYGGEEHLKPMPKELVFD